VRVLIVEDDAEAARTLEAMLRNASCATDVVGAAHAAVERASGERFDAILAAWMLADVDATELIRRLRALVRPCPPIVLITTLDGDEAFETAFRAGADDYLTTPFDGRQLLGRLQTLVARHQAAESMRAPASSRTPSSSRATASARPPPSGAKETPSGRRGAAYDPENQDTPLLLTRRRGRHTAPLGALATPPRALPPVVCVGMVAARTGAQELARVLGTLERGALARAVVLVLLHDRDEARAELVERLQHLDGLPVRTSGGSGSIWPGQIYFIGGDRHVLAQAHPLSLSTLDPYEGAREPERPSADWLFRSIAGSFGRYCMVVVLAGDGADGARGAEFVARMGGLVLAQDPGEAGDGMAATTVRLVPGARVLLAEQLGASISRHIVETSRLLETAHGR
jgi:two-component system chemotaxis response regulator CheB